MPADFASDPEIVRLIAEGERLRYGYLYNPAFATELSLIDPLPHQRIAVYEHMLPQTRLRYLLADDAGAGKTIMTGLYIREMLSRRLLQRILIVAPAGLIGNWERELRTLFRLPFQIITGSDARNGNPFVGISSNLLIVSLDTLAGERMFGRLQESAVTPYDLVIFDEAHKLAADREPDFRVRKTDRYRLAEALAGVRQDDSRWQLSWSAHHLILLTATPHMGRDYPYFCLWRLLEPEALSTFDAFTEYPQDARRRHFIRRAKEEMVRFDGTPIYPTRVSDTHSYDLTQGDTSEQTLYDETTRYIDTHYNRARILNRSAARLAMSIFQRRLASSTFALLESFRRRVDKLDGLIDDIRSGRLTIEQLNAMQRRLERVDDPFETMTADEEYSSDDREENERAEGEVLRGVVATSLAELQAERDRVAELKGLAQRVYDLGEESKFEKLREILQNDRYRDEKIIIFTEHRDTLYFLERKLKSIGYAGQIAKIHGGMEYREREEQVEFFRKPNGQDGARYLIATDAAGEGINLQFCWLMVNYDIPWNPARLEQRMGRIHRYGQNHDPVIILNLVAGKTREGRVLQTLLEKLERIRKQLGSDKVFDVVGRLFEGVSLRAYMERALTESGTSSAIDEIEGTLTQEQVKALAERERRLYGEGGDVRQQLDRLRLNIDQEVYRRLLPGYVRRYIEKAAPYLGIGIDGDLNQEFAFKALAPGALDTLLPILETYPIELRERLTVHKPHTPNAAVFLHPGEPLFDTFQSAIVRRFGADALRGGIFMDPSASKPYLFHLALIAVIRRGDTLLPALASAEALGYKLVGLQQFEDGTLCECPVESLLLLKGGHAERAVLTRFVETAEDTFMQAHAFALENIARPLTDQKRAAFLDTLQERLDFVRRGFDYQDAELAAARSRYAEKAQTGDARAKGELTKIKEQQRQLVARREETLTVLRREPELIVPGEISFLAHALVVPSSDPEDIRRRNDEIEAIAMQVAWAYEEANGARVFDVSKPAGARAAGMNDYPGFDLYAVHPTLREKAIEVKGRVGVGDVEISENEWVKASNLRDRYWLYAVFDCGTPYPRLKRVQDPYGRVLARAKSGVVIDDKEIFQAAEGDL